MSGTWLHCCWIVQVCINQEDADEKSKQIPRMADIYSLAESVQIWLGTVDDLGIDENQTELFLRTANWVNSLSEPEVWMVSLREKLQDQFLDFMDNVGKLARNQWFGRRWVTQEYVLNDRNVVFVFLGGFSNDCHHISGREYSKRCLSDDITGP